MIIYWAPVQKDQIVDIKREQSPKYHHFMYFDCGQTPGFIVPQKIWKSVDEVHAQPFERSSIRFLRNGELGLSLAAALERHPEPHLVPCDMHCRRFKLWMQWPGHPFYSHLLQQTLRSPLPEEGVAMVNLSMLAKSVALSVQAYLTKIKNKQAGPRNDEEYQGWEVDNLSLRDIYLLQLDRVSYGGWQPVLSITQDNELGPIVPSFGFSTGLSDVESTDSHCVDINVAC